MISGSERRTVRRSGANANRRWIRAADMQSRGNSKRVNTLRETKGLLEPLPYQRGAARGVACY